MLAFGAENGCDVEGKGNLHVPLQCCAARGLACTVVGTVVQRSVCLWALWLRAGAEGLSPPLPKRAADQARRTERPKAVVPFWVRVLSAAYSHKCCIDPSAASSSHQLDTYLHTYGIPHMQCNAWE